MVLDRGPCRKFGGWTP